MISASWDEVGINNLSLGLIELNSGVTNEYLREAVLNKYKLRL